MTIPPRDLNKQNWANFSKMFFSSFTHVGKEIKCIIMMSMNPFAKIMKLMAFRPRVQTILQAQYDHIMKMYQLFRNSSILQPYKFQEKLNA